MYIPLVTKWFHVVLAEGQLYALQLWR